MKENIEKQTDPTEGRKFDGNKPNWWLLPWPAIEDVVKVLDMGAKKYASDNWKYVEPYRERYFSAAVRHMVAWKQGEIVDSESGLPHLSHAICCLMFIAWKDKYAPNGMEKST